MQRDTASQFHIDDAPCERAPDLVDIVIDPGFDFLSEEYRALFARADATAFQHPLWLDRFYAQLAPRRGAQKLVVTGRDAEGALILVLPMIRRRKWGIDLIEAADLGVSDYATPVMDRDWRPGPDVARIVAERLPPYDLLRIRPVRAEAVAGWQTFFDAQAEQLDFSAHAVDLAAPYAAWRGQALSPSFARYLDRKRKRLSRTGRAELRLLADAGEVAAAVGYIQELRRGRFQGDPIQSDFVRDFYADVAVAGVAENLTRTYALTLDGEPIGLVFGLIHAGRFHYLLIGCDYEAHGRHSPGLLMYDFIIEDWLADGGDCFDFTIGDEPFKSDFGTSATSMHVLFRYATPLGRLASAGFDLRHRLRRARSKTKSG